LGCGIISAFYAIKLLSIPLLIVDLLAVICTAASISELAKRSELIAAIILSVVLFFSLNILVNTGSRLARKKLFVPVFFLAVFCILSALNQDYVKNEYKRYVKMVKYSGFWTDAVKAWDWLNDDTFGNNIAYIGRPVPFPLYGSNFKNNVYYVSVNSVDPAKLHYFPGSSYKWGMDFSGLHSSFEEAGNYRGGADYTVWLENIMGRKTDYLFVYSLHQTKDISFPIEDSWARQNPQEFMPVYQNETIHIYKILR